jgi:ligand-binding sensor domain-containing protein/signal transduction histidine kinase
MFRLCSPIPIIFSLSASLLAQDHAIKFDRIGLEHGLPQSSVGAIVQDRQGFLWFGTQEGLSKYDGYGFTNYKYQPHDSSSLSENWVSSLCEDRYGTLWVGTHGGGLNKFDRYKEVFTHFRHDVADSNSLSHNFISVIYEDHFGELWIGTDGGGLDRLVFNKAEGPDRGKIEFRHYRHEPTNPNTLNDNSITTLYEDRAGNLWIGTRNGGLNKLARETKTFTHYLHNPANANSLSSNHVLAICEDAAARNNIWIGTAGGGLNKFDQTKNIFEHYLHEPSNPNSLSSNFVTSIYSDTDGLWIGTNGGLDLFDPVKNAFRRYRHDSFNLHSLSANSISVIYHDRFDKLWLGTSLAGVNKFDRKQKAFRHYTQDPSAPNSLSDRSVWSIYEDGCGVLWIGTDGGLNKFDKRNHTIKHYRHDPGNPNSLSHNSVWAICPELGVNGSESLVLWLGTLGGLDKFDTNTEQFTHYRHDPRNPNSLSSNKARVVYLDRARTLWVGTSSGLNKFNRATGAFTHYPHAQKYPGLNNLWIQSIFEDHAQSLWVGTRVGLFKFDRERENFIHYQHDRADRASLSHQSILPIYQDPAGAMWIGTWGGGLNKLVTPTPGEEKFIHFTEKDGLANNVIYGILPDDKGNLWLSTNKGLSKFDPQTQSFKNYDVNDGLQSNEFNGRACFKSPAARGGEMYFGGINGMNSFYPDSIKDNEFVPPVVITAFKKFDKSMRMEREISSLEKIALSYQDDFFAFEFVALDYTNPQANQYAYKLEGFDRDWIYCGARRYASYTNLDPGNYVFRVKGSNSDGVWNEDGAAVKITIHPPFWKTWWFALLGLGSLMISIILIHYYAVKHKIARLQEIENVRKAENERVRKQVADDFHDELGHKLTGIALFAEILKRRLNGLAPESFDYLNKISVTAKSLSGDMRNFIWTLDPEQDSLYDVAIYLKDFGDEVFDKTGIHFQVAEISGDLHLVKLPMNWRRHLTLIIKEGMNNILKHADCRRVVLAMASSRGEVAVTLSDDGKGFDQTHCMPGQGLHNMKMRAAKIHSVVDIISSTGKGTTIRFKGEVPVRKNSKG